MSGNVPQAVAQPVHPYDLLFPVIGQDMLTFLNNLGLKGAVPILRRIDGYIPLFFDVGNGSRFLVKFGYPSYRRRSLV
jgi:hypothetical protein